MQNKSYKVEVFSTDDCIDIPKFAAFSIGEEGAKEIARLAAMAKENQLWQVEKSGYFIKYYSCDETEEATECDSLHVSATGFWFTSKLKHSGIDVYTDSQMIDDLLSHFGLVERGFEVFVGHLDFDGSRIDAEFQVPVGATVAEKDAAFMVAIAQKADINYVAAGLSGGCVE